MAESTRRFRCPCCHKQLEFDTSSGEVREVDKRKDAAERSAAEMDAALKKQEQESDRLGDVFNKAAEDVASQKNKFDDLFNDALKASKNDREKPPNPFDLD